MGWERVKLDVYSDEGSDVVVEWFDEKREGVEFDGRGGVVDR